MIIGVFEMCLPPVRISSPLRKGYSCHLVPASRLSPAVGRPQQVSCFSVSMPVSSAQLPSFSFLILREFSSWKPWVGPGSWALVLCQVHRQCVGGLLATVGKFLTIEKGTQGWGLWALTCALDQREQILRGQTGVGRGDFTLEEGSQVWGRDCLLPAGSENRSEGPSTALNFNMIHATLLIMEGRGHL